MHIKALLESDMDIMPGDCQRVLRLHGLADHICLPDGFFFDQKLLYHDRDGLESLNVLLLFRTSLRDSQAVSLRLAHQAVYQRDLDAELRGGLLVAEPISLDGAHDLVELSGGEVAASKKGSPA